jgi:hypothetical protein
MRELFLQFAQNPSFCDADELEVGFTP